MGRWLKWGTDKSSCKFQNHPHSPTGFKAMAAERLAYIPPGSEQSIANLILWTGIGIPFLLFSVHCFLYPLEDCKILEGRSQDLLFFYILPVPRSKVSFKNKHTLVDHGFPGGSDGKESACNLGDLDLFPESGRSCAEGMTTHSSLLGWRIPGTVEPGRLQSMGSQRVRHDWVTKILTFCQLSSYYLRGRQVT